MRLMSRGNNVQHLDLVDRICALYKNPVLLLKNVSLVSFFLCIFY